MAKAKRKDDDQEVLDVAPASWQTAPLGGEKSMVHEVPAGHVLPPLRTEPQGEVAHEIKDKGEPKH